MDDTATSHVGRVASRQAGLGQLPGYLDPGTLEAVTQGDRTLATWRADHEAFFRSHDPRGRGFRPDTPVVLERVRVLHP